MLKTEIDYILTTLLESGARISDINITVGKPFQIETHGILQEVDIFNNKKPLTPFQTEIFALNIIGNNRRLCEILVREGSCDCSYHLAGRARFRVNIFSQRGYYSLVLRKLENRIPTIEDLNLPKAFYEMAKEINGLILLTGATGTGKSTSIASLMEKINETNAVHIITLEDPIEFVHVHQKATFNQRELGNDFNNFPSGLRAALRQAPKIILVGEMRDRETVEIGLTAAETGHLVFSTLHTTDAGQTINRMISMFDKTEEHLIRVRLRNALRWVVCQRLLPQKGGGRIAIFEIMKANLIIQDLIENGESENKNFYDSISKGDPYGMATFDQMILKAYRFSLITEETALTYSSKRTIISRGIDNIKSEKGEKTTDIGGLEIDERYNDDHHGIKFKKRY